MSIEWGGTLFSDKLRRNRVLNQAAPRRHWMSAWRRMIIYWHGIDKLLHIRSDFNHVCIGGSTVGNANHPFFFWFQHYIYIYTLYTHNFDGICVCVKRCQWCHGDTWWHHPEGKHTYVIYVLSEYPKMTWHRIMCFFNMTCDMCHVHIHTHVHR